MHICAGLSSAHLLLPLSVSSLPNPPPLPQKKSVGTTLSTHQRIPPPPKRPPSKLPHGRETAQASDRLPPSPAPARARLGALAAGQQHRLLRHGAAHALAACKAPAERRRWRRNPTANRGNEAISLVGIDRIKPWISCGANGFFIHGPRAPRWFKVGNAKYG